MTEDHELDVGSFRIEIDLCSDVREVDQMLTDFDGFMPRKFLGPAAMVYVPAHCCDWREQSQLIEHFRPTDVTGMQNPGNTLQVCPQFRTH